MNAVVLLLVSLAFTSGMLAVVFIVAWKTLGRPKHALFWAAGFFTATIQWSWNLNRPNFDNFELYWMGATALSLTVIYLITLGHMHRLKVTQHRRTVGIFSLCAYLIVAYATMGIHHFGLTTGLQPIFAGFMLLYCSHLLLNNRPYNLAERMAAIATAVAGVAQIAAGSAAGLQGWNENAYWLHWYQQLNFTVLPAAYVSTAVLMLLVMASDLAEQLRAVARQDQLTELLNRRGFLRMAHPLFAQSKRHNRPLAAICIDIDHFKRLNDAYGHAEGDRALQHFAAVLRESRRQEDVVARVGGEEFAVMLPDASLEDAAQIAQAIAEQLRIRQFEIEGETVMLTSSFGVAARVSEDETLDDLVRRADQAMYNAKRGGRDQVAVAEKSGHKWPNFAQTVS